MKKHKVFMACMLSLAIFTAYVIMDSFFISRVYGEVNDSNSAGTEEQQNDKTVPEQSEDQSSQADQFGSEDSEGSGNMHDGSGMTSGSHSRGPGGKHGKGGSHSRPGGSGDSDNTDNIGSNGDSDASSESNDSSGKSDSSAADDQAEQKSPSSDSYSDSNISISLKEYRENDTTIYVADVQVSSPEYLKTALAQGAYGRNVTEKTSEIAESAGAILAINGDYYGAQEKGYVIRNGELYRDTAISGQEDLVIYSDGSFGIINESEVTAQQLISSGAQQTLSFGPALVMNGSISVTENEEVGRATASNPRTAIGIIGENHYLFVVSDGRTSESAGLSLYELAEFMRSQGAETAYNLDGGGSSTMYFNGSIVNNPTGGMGSKERSVSDIVYIGK